MDIAASRQKRERSRSVVTALTVSGATKAVYTCPPNCHSRMVLLYVANANGNVSVDIKWYRATDAYSYFIIGGKNLTTGEFIQLSDSYIVLEHGDRIEVTATGATVLVDAFCTVEETFVPN